jgi:hypothetical protein
MKSNPSASTPPSPPPSEAEVDLSRSAVGWTLALVAGVALATFSASYDRDRRGKLEQALENTAVGDTRFYSIEPDTAPPLLFGGAPLVPAEKTPVTMPESRMRLAGYTDDASYRLYVPQERENGDGTAGGPSWYLKAGKGLFLRMSR